MLTGQTNVLVSIRRRSDDAWLDFDDGAFKAAGWTTRQQAMTELDATNDAGVYYYNFSTAGRDDDVYEVRIEHATASNAPQIGEIKISVDRDEVYQSFTYDSTSNSIIANIWLADRSLDLVNQSNATLRLRDSSGTQLAAPSAVAAADAQGVFRFSFANPGLALGDTATYSEASIDYAGTTIRGIVGVTFSRAV
jgi:hypothetical protein